MKNEKFVAIDGIKSNKNTTSTTKKSPETSRGPKLIDSISKRSSRIYQRAVKQSVSTANSIRSVKNMDFGRSPKISKFAQEKTENEKQEAIAVPTHPLVAEREKKQALIRNHLKNQQITPKSNLEAKNKAINEAMAKTPVIEKPKGFFKIHGRAITIIAAIVVLLSGAYISYSKIPGLSVAIASAKAGIDATFPSYIPDGFSIAGPVESEKGVVTIKFNSNSNNTSFTITQTSSSWDSTAVKAKVAKDAEAQQVTYATTEERGLTIYTYAGNAAWVNGGILYEISGDAVLSAPQIRKIATSL